MKTFLTTQKHHILLQTLRRGLSGRHGTGSVLLSPDRYDHQDAGPTDRSGISGDHRYLRRRGAGPAMAISIGFALQAPPLVLFSLAAVGGAANELGGAGGPLAVLIIAILAAECGKIVSKENQKLTCMYKMV